MNAELGRPTPTPEHFRNLPNPGQILEDIGESTRGAGRWINKTKQNLAIVGILTASTLLAISCDAKNTSIQDSKSPTSVTEIAKDIAQNTPEPARATATPAGTGGEQKQTFPNQTLTDINDRLTNPATRYLVPESDILIFNKYMEEANKLGEAAATAQADIKQATAEAVKVPTTAPTIEPTIALTPEKKVAPVEIFPKEMDPYIEIIDYLNPKNDRVLIVGIKGLPEGMTEVPASAPISGGLRNAINDPNYAVVGDLNDLTLTSFVFTNFKTVQDKRVQPGDNIGTLTDKGLKVKLGEREYIAIMYVSTKNPSTDQWDTGKADEIIRQFFPRSPVVSAEYNPSTASNSATPAIKYTVAFEDQKPAGLK